MKYPFKSLLLAATVLAAASCAKDDTQSGGEETAGPVIVNASPAAIGGEIILKLKTEASGIVEKSRAQGVSKGSGIDEIDRILNTVNTVRFERLFPDGGRFEERTRREGLHLWYYAKYDPSVPTSEMASLLSSCKDIEIIEYSLAAETSDHRRAASPAAGAQSVTRAIADEVRNVPFPFNESERSQQMQWHYNNTGNIFAQTSQLGADANVYAAWQLSTGNPDVIVAVVDQGVKYDHEDLAANMWVNEAELNGTPGVDDDGNGYVDDIYGYNFTKETGELDFSAELMHGTHVAGTIAAVNNNGRGVCGIAGGRSNSGGVRIMSCQIMGNSTTGGKGNPTVKAFEYAWTNGAIIAQNSWGYNLETADGTKITPEEFEREWKSNYGIMRDAIDTFVRGAGTRNPNSPLQGGLVIFAAGNEGDVYGDVRIYPAAYDPVIAVGAMDWSFRPAYYTDYGPWVDIAAPGGDRYSGKTTRTASDGRTVFYSNAQILSTILCDDAIAYQDGRKDGGMYGYGFMQGTSMACPHVSGVAALGLAYAAQNGKKYTPAEFKALLLSSVYGIDDCFAGSKDGELGPIADMAVYKNKMGGGCIDALKLLFAVKGTPAVYVRTGEPVTVDFARYFGGDRSRVALTAASFVSPGNLGLSSSKAVFDGTKITFDCPEPGTSMLRISAVSGDTEFVREFAVVSRAGLAANGGWL